MDCCLCSTAMILRQNCILGCVRLALLLQNLASLGGARPFKSNNQYDDESISDSDHSIALSYLTRFGYLPQSEHETESLRSIEELRDAVRTFQSFAQLPVTGVFDVETVQMMNRPRCGNVDIEARAGRRHGGLIDRPQAYILGPSKWDKTAITFRFVSFTPDLDYKTARDAFVRALYLWSDVTHLTFHEIQHGEADIMIQFSRGYHQDGYPFDGPGLVLAHAFFPGEGRGGDIHFDDDETWTAFSEAGTDLFTVASHELGHALGLSHSKQFGALMYPWHQEHTDDPRLHPDDISAIQHLYGYKEFTHRPTRTPVSTRRQITNVGVAHPTTSGVLLANPLDPGIQDADPVDRADHHCHLTGLDAISTIRGEIFAFRGKRFWRIDSHGDIVHEVPMDVTRFWFGFPDDFEGIDAVFEKPDENGTIVFFKGNRFWEFTENRLSPGFPQAGRPLSDLDLPSEVDHIDGAFVWGYNRMAYLISGYAYWRLETGSDVWSVVKRDYPRDMSVWAGVPVPIDDAFTHTDGHLYFFQGENYWRFSDARMSIRDGYPKKLRQKWFPCDRKKTDAEVGPGTSSTSNTFKLYSQHLRLTHSILFSLIIYSFVQG